MKQTKHNRLVRKVGKTLMVIMGLLAAGLLLLLGGLLYLSPGRIAPFKDADGKELAGSIAEKLEVEINGVRHGMFIRGKDINNPVLLFVHGGPGMPEYFIINEYEHPLEDLFTVCWMEQRGAGRSYDPGLKAEDITMDNLVRDIIGASNYLRERFGQEKIYLMAHSFGTYPGIHAAQAAPELYHAYLGMAQMTNRSESEQIAFDYMVAEYRRQGNETMVRKMEQAMADGKYRGSGLRDQAMHELGVGTTRKMKSVVTDIFLASWKSPIYTLPEKINLWRGKAGGITGNLTTASSVDLTTTITRLELPVYFFSGSYDYTVNIDLARNYLGNLEAPAKGFYTFPESAHSPLIEEPDRMAEILRDDVLNGTFRLAD